MAGIAGAVVNSTAITVAAVTAKHILNLIAPSNQRLLVKEIIVSMQYAAASAPTNETARVDICRNTTTGTATSLTPVKMDVSADETLQATAGENHSSEPTVGAVLMAEEISPLLGGIFRWIAPRREDMIPVKGGQGLGIRLFSDWATTTRSFIARMVYEE